MIQRIQSLYLLAMSMVAFIFILTDCTISKGRLSIQKEPVHFAVTVHKTIVFQDPDSLKALNTLPIGGGRISESPHTALIIIFAISGLLACAAILLFRNLRLQLRLVTLNFLLVGLGLFMIYYTHRQAITSFETLLEDHLSLCLVLPVSMVFFNFLAFRSIKKDIDLLASADRLR